MHWKTKKKKNWHDSLSYSICFTVVLWTELAIPPRSASTCSGILQLHTFIYYKFFSCDSLLSWPVVQLSQAKALPVNKEAVLTLLTSQVTR